MKRLLLGLAVLSAAAFSLSATGTAQTWKASSLGHCSENWKPSCPYGEHAHCESGMWECVASAERQRGYGGYGESRSNGDGNTCLQESVGITCQAGWAARCVRGHMRCEPLY